MELRRVTTEASVWIFDQELMRYVRLPRNEAPDSDSAVRYTGEWEPYEALSEFVDGSCKMGEYKVMVLRPVPIGQGRLRQSGVVVEDTHAPQAQITAGVQSTITDLDPDG